MKEKTGNRLWNRDEIDSPCIKICAIHPTERICVGCYRSIEEVAEWSKLSLEQRSTLMKDLPGRAHRIQKRRGGRRSRTLV